MPELNVTVALGLNGLKKNTKDSPQGRKLG